MKDEKRTYRRLMTNIVQEITALRPDSDAKLKERLNKKFEKYAKKAGFDIQNGATGNQNN